jgi:hypothetical protein
MNNKPPYGFLRDNDGNWCEKRLAGLILGFLAAVMFLTYFFYGLWHIIVDHTIIDAAYAIGGLSGTLLGITVFQKPRNGNNDEKTD